MGSNNPVFLDMVRTHGPSIFGLLVRYVRDRGTAEDLWQDTFFSASVALDRGESPREPAAWLRSIAVRKAVDFARRSDVRPVVADTLDAASATAAPKAASASRVDFEDDLAALPAVERTVVLLAYREAFTMAEIAELFAVPIGTVKTWLSRARAALRPRFEEDRR